MVKRAEVGSSEDCGRNGSVQIDVDRSVTRTVVRGENDQVLVEQQSRESRSGALHTQPNLHPIGPEGEDHFAFTTQVPLTRLSVGLKEHLSVL